jgi:hypothetical protein
MPHSEDADFASVAEELYAVPAAGFVAERNARAKAARSEGDRDLAARITALPKPSVSAWLVNLLVHDDLEGLDRVLELSDELRSAQEGADRARLRELGEQRRALLAELARTTAALAEDQGAPPTAAALEEFQQTLQAALVDEGAAAAVRTGRLVRALTADGFDPTDLTNAVGGPGAKPSARPKRGAARPGADATDGKAADGEAERRRREEAERAAAEAAGRAAAARRAADDAADRTREAEAEVERRDGEVQDLTARLEELQRRLASARQDLDDAKDAAEDARTAEEEATEAAADAEAEAADLQGSLDP